MKSVPVFQSHAAALKPGLAYLFFPLIALTLLFAWPDVADAKRIGGGGSFGSKPSYGSGYTKPAAQPKSAPGMQQAAPSPGSRFGGLGGMFGGLLMGGLLGSMLFGGGFSGPGMLDLLLLGFGGFLLLKFIRSRRTATATAAPYANAGSGATYDPVQGGGWGNQVFRQPGAKHGPDLPDGVDEQEFLAGAKALYIRLQSSWDRRDLHDIGQFTTQEVYREISRQAELDPSPGRTEILMLEARVLEARTVGSETVISVLFDAMLREGAQDAPAEQIREVWHVRRDQNAPQWTLEGIQQLQR
ncbi:MAG: Tim44 domain-containing protein [Desulfovibrionales bacterium]|nr:Tim44 domain-containing protein [Desulfovibrionales bacterium]